MTREEFITGYMARSGMPAKWRTPDGYACPVSNEPGLDHLPPLTRVALECHCGEEGCEGWAMIPGDAESIAVHRWRNGDGPLPDFLK